MPQALEHGATCFQGTHLSLRFEGNEFPQQLPVFNSILFFQEMGSSCKVFKCVDLLWSVLRSGEEQILLYKWDRSELMIKFCCAQFRSLGQNQTQGQA